MSEAPVVAAGVTCFDALASKRLAEDDLALPVPIASLATVRVDRAENPLELIAEEPSDEVGFGIATGLGVGSAFTAVVRTARRRGLSLDDLDVSFASPGGHTVAAGVVHVLHGSSGAFVAGLSIAPEIRWFVRESAVLSEEALDIATLLAFVAFGALLCWSIEGCGASV